MEGKRRASALKPFRLLLYCALGVVLSSYLLLFVLVASRHLDRAAEGQLRAAVSGQRPAGGMERFRDRWAAVARAPANPRRRVQMCSRPRFRNPPGPRVALASFPGSGNTWVRFLLQQATGILTGSVYRDYSLKRNGFPAESVANGSVLLVKTHEWGERVRRSFQKAVLLVREPFGALLAEFNRRAGGHVGHASPDKFHRGNAWQRFVLTHSKVWLENTLDWLHYEGPLLILRYDLMKEELPSELVRLLQFLEVNVSWPVFQCVLRNKDGIFRRAKRPLLFNPFDESLKNLVDGYKDTAFAAIRLRESGRRLHKHNATLHQPYFNATSGARDFHKTIESIS